MVGQVGGAYVLRQLPCRLSRASVPSSAALDVRGPAIKLTGMAAWGLPAQDRSWTDVGLSYAVTTRVMIRATVVWVQAPRPSGVGTP